MDSAPLLPIPQLPGQATDLIAAYQQLIVASPNQKPNQPLFTMASAGGPVIVNTRLLTNAALKHMLHGLGMDSTLSSRLAVYCTGVDIVDVKRHGNWSSETFCGYTTASFITHHPETADLARYVASLTPL